MKASEVRIGNWVEGYLEPPISEWVEMKVCIGVLSSIESNPDTHGFRPIILTEKWLDKFGFEKVQEKGGFYYEKTIFANDSIRVFDDNSVATYFFHNVCHVVYPQEFHAHQLQNLYYALTGEELTIKNN
jgi:hypothetical protein